jgi:hypothetical protein
MWATEPTDASIGFTWRTGQRDILGGLLVVAARGVAAPSLT